MQSASTGEVEINDIWTQEKCLELMRLYKHSPMLWDANHPYYYKKIKRIAAWKKMSEELQIPYIKVRAKMQVILSSFRREKVKLTRHIKFKQHFTSSWYGFKELSFLLIKESMTENRNNKNPNVRQTKTPSSAKHIKPQPSTSQAIDTDDDSADEIVEIDDEISAYTNAKQNELEKLQPSTSPETEMAADAAEMSDEISAFTNFIALKMRKYSQATNNAVQEAICDIIFKADQHFYEPVICGTTSIVNPIVPSTSTASIAKVSRARSDSVDIDTLVVIKDELDEDDSVCSVSS